MKGSGHYYSDEYYNSDAYKKIKDNADAILYYSDYYGVDPQTVAACIFVEQYYNYDWVDEATDWIGKTGIIDMSMGLGQVRVSTAKYLEENGYLPKVQQEDETSMNRSLVDCLIPCVNEDSKMRGLRLEDDKWNIQYVAAYIKCLQDIWSEDYPEISADTAILGALYNLGHNKIPHDSPQSNWFGDYVNKYYQLMGDALWER